MKFRVCLELKHAYTTYQNCGMNYSGSQMEICSLKCEKKKV